MSSYILQPGDRWQIDKDPDASLIYGIDVADIIAPGDTLTGAPTAAASGDAGVTVGAASFIGTVIQARISGGTVGAVAALTWSWQTAGGDTDQRTVYLRIVQR